MAAAPEKQGVCLSWTNLLPGPAGRPAGPPTPRGVAPGQRPGTPVRLARPRLVLRKEEALQGADAGSYLAAVDSLGRAAMRRLLACEGPGLVDTLDPVLDPPQEEHEEEEETSDGGHCLGPTPMPVPKPSWDLLSASLRIASPTVQRPLGIHLPGRLSTLSKELWIHPDQHKK